MDLFKKYIGKPIELSISGQVTVTGILLDEGSDILVVYNGEDYIYIPILHIHYINFQYENEEDIETPDSIPIKDQNEAISFRKILNNAKGIFVELYITDHPSLHGYITHVMNDYFIFFSPVYKTIFIPLQHLKLLIPYHTHQRPYDLDNQELPLNPSNISLSRTFEEQCKKYIGKMTVFDLGKDPRKVGKLTKLQNGQIELIIARHQAIYLNFNHIKAVHFP
jgi:hypothetical protein